VVEDITGRYDLNHQPRIEVNRDDVNAVIDGNRTGLNSGLLFIQRGCLSGSLPPEDDLVARVEYEHGARVDLDVVVRGRVEAGRDLLVVVIAAGRIWDILIVGEAVVIGLEVWGEGFIERTEVSNEETVPVVHDGRGFAGSEAPR